MKSFSIFIVVFACLFAFCIAPSFALQNHQSRSRGIFQKMLNANPGSGIRIASNRSRFGRGFAQQQDPTEDAPQIEAPQDSGQDEEAAPKQAPRPQFESSQWPKKSIQEMRLDIRDPSGEIPEDRSLDLVNGDNMSWISVPHTQKLYAWAAPNIRYQPLYFEHVAMERYGQTACGKREFLSSAIHFYGSTLLLPLHLRTTPPKSCDYPLGF